jgi:signal transduction histidine kinase
MQYKHRLRSRIIVSFLVFGTLLSALFASSVFYLRQRLENQLIGDWLQAENDQYLEEVRRGASEAAPISNMQGYVVSRRNFDKAPEWLKELETGVHDVKDPGDIVRKVAVRKEDDYWAFLMMDMTQQTEEEQMFFILLIGSVVVFSALSLALGFWSSRRVMAPVTALAQRIEQLSKEKRVEDLARYFADDEVGQVAEALDDYSHRLTALVERDKEFNADVSHELRTPLAVIRGATELLLTQPDLDERVRHRVVRIERACQQSIELTQALLHLARDRKADAEMGEVHSVEDIVDQVVEFHRPQLANKPVDVHVQIREPLKVRAPLAVLTVAVGNLVGNAFKYTNEGQVTIILDRKRLVVEDTGPGVGEEELPQIFARHYRGKAASSSKGSGLGLAIVKRLCDLYDWQVTASSKDGQGLRAELLFSVSERQAA